MQVTFNGKINTQYPRTNTNRTQKALTTTAAWFAFGVGLDLVGRKCQVFKSPTKNSVFINSIIAAGAGLFTYLAPKFSKVTK